MKDSASNLNRRHFVRNISFAAAGLSIAGCASTGSASRSRRIASSEKLNIGIIGAGGRGADNLAGVKSEKIVAICDVDDERAAKSHAAYPQAARYKDFRKMLDREKNLDAVVVSTPDHMHAICAITAMRAGKHVYCEKPLAHSIWEARQMRKIATESGVITQMGQQGHAMEGSRRAVEVIRSGAIGDVKEVHVWTDRPAGWWPQGVERPTETPPVPPTLDWDLWLGTAPWRPYNPIYVPFKWRGFWDFGTGAIGDMGVHNMDVAFWSLELGIPVAAEVRECDRKTSECPPLWSIIDIYYPSRGSRPPVKLTFYDGKKLPPLDLFLGEKQSDNGSLIIGSKGTLFTRDWHGGTNPNDMFMLLPKRQFVGYQAPAPTLPRTQEHHIEWIEACKGIGKAQSDFGYASMLTEGLLVGQLAIRTGQRIEWDAKSMRATNCRQAERYIKPEFRKGWEI
jgi:hypothetical protein